MSRTERTTVNMADGYSRINNGRKLGVVVTQSGPGAENAVGGIAHAYAESVPILVLPGGTPRGSAGQPPDFSAVDNYRGITKWTAQINQTERIPELMRRAYTQLKSGRGGPVALEVPQDVGGDELDEAAFDYRPLKALRSMGDPEDVAAAARAILSAKRPVIYAGQGILWAEASDELKEFAELVNCPVTTTNPGKSSFPENHASRSGHGGPDDDQDGEGLHGKVGPHLWGRGGFRLQPGQRNRPLRQDACAVHRRRGRPEQAASNRPRRRRGRQAGAATAHRRGEEAGRDRTARRATTRSPRR